jgi:hypothetical protein
MSLQDYSTDHGSAILTHLLGKVALLPESSPIWAVLKDEGISTIGDLLSLTEDDISALSFTEDETWRPLLRGLRNLIRLLINYIRSLQSEEFDIYLDYTKIDSVGFAYYRTQPTSSPSVPSPMMSPPFKSPTPFQPVHSATSAAESFRRSIKKDPSLFPILKDERANDAWHYSFVAQARAQGVGDVLNPAYVPRTPDESALFQEQQKYLYAVFEQKVQTLKGRSIVREHEHDFNAQEVYKKLSEHHLHSARARLDASSILRSITTDRLGNGSWKGSTEQFLEHWKSQVRLYERQIPRADHFSDFHKKAILENAVSGVPELRQIKQNVDLAFVQTGKDVTFDEYYSLVYAAAVNLDHGFQQRRDKRHALLHELDESAPTTFGRDDPDGHEASPHPTEDFAHDDVLAYVAQPFWWQDASQDTIDAGCQCH